MSLILDALKKVEREKTAPEPGVVVVASLPWHGLAPVRDRRWLVALTLLGVVAVAVAVTWWIAAPRPSRGRDDAAVARRAPAQPAGDGSAPATTTTPPQTGAASLPTAAPPPATAVSAAADPDPVAPPPPRRLVLPGDTGTATPPPATRASEAAGEPGSQRAEGAAAAPARRPGADDLQLMAISQRDGQPIAIINDHLLREGDSFDGVAVVRIGESEVEVEVRGRRRVLRF